MKISDANTQLYGYDKLYQLTAVDYNDGNKTWYYYDKLGNRTKVTENTVNTLYDSNALNMYTTVNGTAFEYDKNGNLTYDGQYTYIYDCENRLLEVKQGETTIVTYAYDFKGRRVRRTEYISSITQCFTYDGDQIIADYNEAGVWKKRYYYGPGIDQPICMVRTPGAPAFVNYYHYDGLGNVAALSNYNGALIEKYTYDVYGKPTIRYANNEPRPTSFCDNRYMFTGREYDPCVGIYYYRARYYNPTIGRFIQTDPSKYADSLNFYTYVKNNPICLRDPRGLWTEKDCGAGLEKAGEGFSESTKECVREFARDSLKNTAKCMVICILTAPAGPGAYEVCEGTCEIAATGLDAWVIRKCLKAVDKEMEYAHTAYDYCMCRARGCSVSSCVHR